MGNIFGQWAVKMSILEQFGVFFEFLQILAYFGVFSLILVDLDQFQASPRNRTKRPEKTRVLEKQLISENTRFLGSGGDGRTGFSNTVYSSYTTFRYSN